MRREVHGRLGPPTAHDHSSRSSNSSETAEGVRRPRSVKRSEMRWGGVASHDMSYEAGGACCATRCVAAGGACGGGGGAAAAMATCGGGAAGSPNSHGNPHSAELPQPASGCSSCVRQKR